MNEGKNNPEYLKLEPLYISKRECPGNRLQHLCTYMYLYIVLALMLVLEVSKSGNICAPERQCHPHQQS